MSTARTPPTIFISYSHQDERFLKELLEQVGPTLKGLTDMAVWSDKDIATGDLWETEIFQAIDSAAAAVLLISSRFLNSRYITEKELPALLPRVEAGELRLFSLHVGKVARDALRVPIDPAEPGSIVDLAGRQAENRSSRPLNKLTPAQREDVLCALAKELSDFAKQIAPIDDPPPSTPPVVSQSPPHRPGAPAPRRTSLRPECLIRLTWYPRHNALERHLLLPLGRTLQDPTLPAEDAIAHLAVWQPGQPFAGDRLFELLFGTNPDDHRDLLADPFGEGQNLVDPGAQDWRIRLLLDGQPLLQALPWTRISHQGSPLAEMGWTVELCASGNGTAWPELGIHAFKLPGRFLLFIPDAHQDPLAAAHRADCEHLLHRLWDKPAPVLVATSEAELEVMLREQSPRLVYVHARLAADADAARLLLPGAELDLADLAGRLSAEPPSALLLNLIGADGAHAALATAGLCAPRRCRFVGLQVNATDQADQARAAGLGWLEAVLAAEPPADPVAALHRTAAGFVAARAAYQAWDPQLGPAHLDEDLAHWLLDRHDQRANLAQYRNELYDLAPAPRVHCLLAVGSRGNRVDAFPGQALTHLQLHPRERVQTHCYQVALLPTDADPERIETSFRRRLGLWPSQPLIAGLRPRRPSRGNDRLLALLSWTIDGPATAEQRSALARAVLRFSREALAAGDTGDLRILSLIALETVDAAETEALREALEAEDEALAAAAPSAAFQYDALATLAGVHKRDLRRYFDSDHCTCPKPLRPGYPELLLAGRRELPFDEAVDQLRAARGQWAAHKARLERGQP